MNCEVVNGGKVTKLKVNLNVNKIIHIVTLKSPTFQYQIQRLRQLSINKITKISV